MDRHKTLFEYLLEACFFLTVFYCIMLISGQLALEHLQRCAKELKAESFSSQQILDRCLVKRKEVGNL